MDNFYKLSMIFGMFVGGVFSLLSMWWKYDKETGIIFFIPGLLIGGILGLLINLFTIEEKNE